MLEIKDLTIQKNGRKILKEINLNCNRGEIHYWQINSGLCHYGIARVPVIIR